MRDFFNLDGPFNKYGGLIADMIILSFMWLLFSVIGLGITIGASTSALFYVSTRRIANREGYITRDFWEAFKANIKKATIVWLLALLMVWLIWFNITNIDAVGGLRIIILPAQLVLLIEVVFMSVYAFPMIARFDMGLKHVIKTSFFMANRHMLTSVCCVALLVAAFYSFFFIPPIALFIAPGLYATLASYMIMKIFKRYRPEMDKDPILEIQEIEAQKAEERRWKDIKTIDEKAEDKIEDKNNVWEDQNTDETPPTQNMDDAVIANVDDSPQKEVSSDFYSIINKDNNAQPLDHDKKTDEKSVDMLEDKQDENVDIWTKIRQMEPDPPAEPIAPKKKPKKETTAEDDFWASV